MKETFVRIPFASAGRPVALAGILLLASGCAALSDGLSPDAGTALTGLNSSPPEITSANPGALDQSQAADMAASPEVVAQASESRPAEPTSDTQEGAKAADAPPKDAPDEFYDPFAKKEEVLAAGEDYDPWEGFNSVMFEFNRKFDKYLLKPVAQVYDKIIPNALQKGISNFMHNARVGPRLINNILQLKIKGTGMEIGRLLINSTIGIAGFFDPAKNWFDLTTPDEDTGQTLGSYGVPPGPYLVLPLLPPLTLRDFFGLILDFGADPINYFVFPTFEVDDLPSLIAHKNRDTTTIAQLGTRVDEIVNYRSLNLETFEGVEEATVDLYSAVRNAYLQKRAKAIRE
jgi:phospholipid-binding lipoprotein MlaA